jgi:hypothetical protein
MSTEKRGVHGAEQIRGWFTGRLPDGWFVAAPDILVDREEITVIGQLSSPAAGGTAGGGPAQASAPGGTGAAEGSGPAEAGPAGGATAEAEAAAIGRSRRFREETRDARIEIAREAEHTFGRKVSWGVTCDSQKVMFTTLSVPVMTRLRQPERRVLDTLVDAGVARSRSDALAWCARLVGEHEDSWLSDLRAALSRVEEVRGQGPQA